MVRAPRAAMKGCRVLLCVALAPLAQCPAFPPVQQSSMGRDMQDVVPASACKHRLLRTVSRAGTLCLVTNFLWWARQRATDLQLRPPQKRVPGTFAWLRAHGPNVQCRV